MDARTAALTTLALAGLLAPGCSSSKDQVGFEVRRPDPNEIAQRIKADKEALGDYKPADQAARVVKFFHTAQLQTVSLDPVEPAVQEATLTNLRMAAKRLLIEHGQRAASRLGLHLLAGFERELDALAAASRQVDGATVALLTGAPPPDGILAAYKKFARFGGGFLVHAAANDLVKAADGGGLDIAEADRFFIRLAFKVYWANVMPEGTDAMDWVLDDFERRWYEIWVVERSKTATLERKLAALGYLERHDADYPVKPALGVVLYQAHRYDEAVKAFEQGLEEKPGDERLERFLAAARRKAR